MADRITFAPEFKAEVQAWMQANPQKTRVATIAAAGAHFKGKAKSKEGKKATDPSSATLGLWYNGVAQPKARKGRAKATTAAKKRAGRKPAATTPVAATVSKAGTRLIEQARDLEKRIHDELVQGLKNLDSLHNQLSGKMVEYEKIFNRKAEDVFSKNKDLRDTLSRVGLAAGITRTPAKKRPGRPAKAKA